MSNILNSEIKKGFEKRILNIKPGSKALWGRMSITGMLCHTADQVRLTYGEKSCKPMSNFITRSLVKKLVLMGMPSPKGKLKTAPEIDAEKDGTPSVGFDGDVKALLYSIEKFIDMEEEVVIPDHPVFGYLTKNEWGRLIYIHLDFHLKQFGH